MEEVSDKEMASRVRKNVIDTLELWASKEEQFEYKKNAPFVNIPQEMFCWWLDDHYHPNNRLTLLAFNEKELKLLSEFDNKIRAIDEKLNGGPEKEKSILKKFLEKYIITTHLVEIYEFVKTEEWAVLNKAAKETLKELNIN